MSEQAEALALVDEMELKRNQVLRDEARQLLCDMETINKEDQFQYRKGYRLIRVGTLLNDEEYKRMGWEFVDHFRVK